MTRDALPALVSTEDGVTSAWQGAAQLKSLLLRLESAIQAAGALVDQLLAPGLGESEIRSKLAAVGLVAPDELVEWFRWHNGYTQGRTSSPLFPLLLTREMIGYAVQCVSVETPLVRVPNNEFHVPWNAGNGQAVSLCTPIIFLISLIEGGEITWDPDAESWRIPVEFPPTISKSILG